MKVEYFTINELKNAPFKYLLITGPIDYWTFSLTEEQVIGSMAGEFPPELFIRKYNRFTKIVDYVSEIVTSIEERPHTIRFTGIPNPEEYSFDLVVIAKISNNGLCFIFSDNYQYLKNIKRH